MRDLIKAGLATLFLSLRLAAPVAAGPYEDGMAAYRSGDDATALRFLGPLANQGYAPAQMTLGSMYQFGRGVPQDYSAAAKWFRKAADQGYAPRPAQHRLHVCRGPGRAAERRAGVQVVQFGRCRAPGIEHREPRKRDQVPRPSRREDDPDQVAEAQKLASEWKPSGP